MDTTRHAVGANGSPLYIVGQTTATITLSNFTVNHIVDCLLRAHGVSQQHKQRLIYLVDIIVFSSSLDEHLKRLANVFHTLRHAHLQLKLSKCSFMQKEVWYLGQTVYPSKCYPRPETWFSERRGFLQTVSSLIIICWTYTDCHSRQLDTVLTQLHNQSDHIGGQKTLGVKERYYWPGYKVDVSTWIQKCRQYQQRKSPHQPQKTPLHTITSNYPFEKLSWDIMEPLPLSSTGNYFIIVR